MQKAVCTSPLIRLYPIGSDAHGPIGNNWLFIINMEVAVMAYLFDLDLFKTSQEERIIKGKMVRLIVNTMSLAYRTALNLST